VEQPNGLLSGVIFFLCGVSYQLIDKIKK